MKGFTLIELLVVVLIIGILAAVAFPQYQVAVEKSRATEVMVLLRSMRTAIESYQMETGLPPVRLMIWILLSQG
ncbi:MAG: type IV pilin protein [Candidatus Avelusimicrobium sp.]|uniref:type IV pilin protein n=1 Tax=Candidatus Avelusimicrobium sp. TaxID=3048833 RepID=UPI003F0BC261